MKVEPAVECVEAVQAMAARQGRLVMLTPQGRPLDQPAVERLAAQERILLLCGRYEGFDERIRIILKPQEISIGDYVLNGGEVAAMVIIDAVIRLVPGVLGDEDSTAGDSFSGERRYLEFAQYTRPREYRGLEAPEVLLSGNHEEIARWRDEDSRRRTQSAEKIYFKTMKPRPSVAIETITPRRAPSEGWSVVHETIKHLFSEWRPPSPKRYRKEPK